MFDLAGNGELVNPRDVATYYFNRTSSTTQSILRAMQTVALDPVGLRQQARMLYINHELKAGRYEVHEGRIRRKA